MNNFFVKHKNGLSAIIFLIILGGFFAYSKMQTSLFPEITFPKIKIIADAGQQPIDKMMITVTKPLENAIKKVQDLKTVRSTTSRGSCEISAFMDWKSDIDLSKTRIEAQINQIKNNLPPDTQITVEKMNPSILPVIGYAIEGKGMSAIELKKIANYTIKPFLSQIDGVSEIRIIGGKEKEYWLSLDFDKMRALGISPNLITQVMSETNFIKSNGYLSDYRYLYLTITDAQVDKKDELENLVIRNNGKGIVTLKDIATVEIKEAKEFIKVNANGKESILIAVIKQPNSNLISLTVAMNEKLQALKKILPSSIKITPFYEQANFVNDAVKSVTDSLLIGLLLAIIVAVLFLKSAKASATILIIIPVTLGLTLIVLYLTGQTFNIMTLGAIAAALGLIIDDAIVVVEQIHRTHEEHPDEPTVSLLQKAIHYLFPAMVGSSISTIVIFIPFVLMSGVAGSYFKVLTDTMIITLVCSFFVTWLLLPVVYLLLSKKVKNASETKKETEIHEVKTQNWVAYFIGKPILSISFCIVLILSIFIILPNLETGFLPEMDEGSIILDYESPPGTSLEETDRMLNEVEKIIIKIPEVEAYSRRTGTQMGFFITEPNRGDYLIQLKKDRNKTSNDVIDEIRQKVEATQPALRIDFGQVIGDMLGDLMSSVSPIEVKIYGSNQQELQKIAKRVNSIVEKVKGTADVFDGIILAGPAINIQPNYSQLAQYGITPTDLQFQMQTALEGNVVGSLLENEQTTPIRLIYSNSKNRSLEDIKKLQLFLPTGQAVPISSLVTISVQKGVAEIERENLQMMSVVTGRLDNRDLGSVMQEIQKKVSSEIHLPTGYYIEYAGAYKDQQQSFKELLMILIASSLLVFGVILFLFRDFRVALVILLISVLGISGSYILLFITNTPLNVGSYTGIIMIVGIISENAIFTFLQFRETFKLTRNVNESIIYSISTRLRPKLMTALGAIIALLPLAIGIGTGSELHQPLAIAVIGGFLIAMPLLLIVLPSLLCLVYKNEKHFTHFN
ncbi:CzcA family heavy metal efflux pump [Flavobacterium sp. CG_23.5]|uniref:efflux RND transporter permease subunit n=1 Tax=unclassified Flavobacterium TaxID=196869 RepID=UPI0018CBC01B|nr:MULTISPECIES: efflux RND transporter permease subunit [unclassified Flavobacterium]MBG6110185.1 CzcA family heavy metal efflux pump [Flavobacterium sp. CG_9.10]MBP2281818.1 CzcA family heavy metal efflux pump [Flavobacterium sp. CG_23.5]